MSPNFKLSAEQRIPFKGMCKMRREEVHNANEGFIYYWCKQVKYSPLRGLRINRPQPQSGADRCYICYTNLCGCQYLCHLFSRLEMRGFLPQGCFLDWRSLPMILKSSKGTALTYPNCFCSVCFFRWHSIYFFNSRQLCLFAFISSIMFTIPIRTFCNLI